MGLTIYCKKTNRSIDMGAGGFFRLRLKVAELLGEPWHSHYATLRHPPLFEPARTEFFNTFDQRTKQMLQNKQVPIKVVDFCLQSDVEGCIHYGACKQIYKVVQAYDDDIAYGYAGRPDCAKFADFKAILKDCIDNKCDMVWR